MNFCKIDGCGRPGEAIGNGQRRRVCPGHRARKKKYGDVLAAVPIYGMKRARIDFAEPISYVGAHQRVYVWRGKAREQVCTDCGNQATEWSYLGGSLHEQTGLARMGTKWRPARWSSNPDDYSPRCKPCHAAFDRHGKAA